ncbi:MAG: hypothetical protein FJZ87_11135 [Chloroflexi bacterium]|nr:hypothetical protein [Chloroflexota bacterium]
MTGFDFKWAVAEDEPEIRALVGSVAMPGAVTVRFAREPDYFLGAGIMGDPCDVMIARHQSDGRLAGIACRARRQAFFNGQETIIGYIGQIRVAPDFRGNWLVHRGAKPFLEGSPPGLLYTGVIASENPRARDVLVGARLPGNLHAARVCGLTTCAILLRPQRALHRPGLDVQPGRLELLEEIVSFLRLHGPSRQFFPAYRVEDFSGGSALRDLQPQDILVARRGSRIVGVMAVWDQSNYKQDIVDSYGPGLRLLRPLYDLAARLIGANPLTPPGQAIPLAFAACICIKDDDPTTMRALLSAAMQEAQARGKAFLMIGMADDDPLLAVARRPLHIPYHSELYAVSQSKDAIRSLDGRIPYIEIATL